MVRDSDIPKLCRGRIVRLSNVINSAGDNAAGPHWAVLLDTDEQIAEAIEQGDELFVAVISSNAEIDSTYLVSVPARTGLEGNIICSWCPGVHPNAIESVRAERLIAPELLKISRMYRAYKASLKGR